MDDRTLVSGNEDEEPQFPHLARQAAAKPFFFFLIAHFNFLGNFNLNGPLMSSKKKTMDEVWKEIVHHDHHPHEQLHHHTMTTIGEPTTATTTPEHLLVRAGILNAHPMIPIDPTAVVSQQADWFQFQVTAAAQQQMTMLDSNFKVCESVFENSSSAVNLDNYSESHQVGGLSIPMPAISAASSSESQTAQKSAARSRARKQAYTNQLENEVFHLRKMNTWLKKQKEVEILLSSNPTNSMPQYQLRRTSSASF
ncbi:hypothetical protein M0R45_027663 [Rubus argutus]|uniref:BZIP domain-containing protein n=1 Tax=Rubus argutus TaxID=59490 RepID=A0AAW1X3N6_RUBAR